MRERLVNVSKTQKVLNVVIAIAPADGQAKSSKKRINNNRPIYCRFKQ